MKVLKKLKRTLAFIVAVLIVATSIQLPAFAQAPIVDTDGTPIVEIPIGGKISLADLKVALDNPNIKYTYHAWAITKYQAIGTEDYDDGLNKVYYDKNTSAYVEFQVRHYVILENKSATDVIVKQDNQTIENGNKVYSTSDVGISFDTGKTRKDGIIEVKGQDVDLYSAISYDKGTWTLDKRYLGNYYVENGKLTVEYIPFDYNNALTVDSPVSGLKPTEWAGAFDKNLNKSSIYYAQIKFDSGNEYSNQNSDSVYLQDGRHYYQYKEAARNADFGDKVPFIVRNYYTFSKGDNASNITVKQGGVEVTENKLYTDVESYTIELNAVVGKKGALLVNGEEISADELGGNVYTLYQNELANLQENGSIEFSAVYTNANLTIGYDSPKPYGIIEYENINDSTEQVTVTPEKGCAVKSIKLVTKEDGKDDVEEELVKGTPEINAPVTVTFANDGAPKFYYVSAECEVKNLIEIDASAKNTLQKWKKDIHGIDWVDYDSLKITKGDNSTEYSGKTNTLSLEDGIYSSEYKPNKGEYQDKTFFKVKNYYPVANSDTDNIEISAPVTIVDGKLYSEAISGKNVQIKLKKYSNKNGTLKINGDAVAKENVTDDITYSNTSGTDPDYEVWTINENYLKASNKLEVSCAYKINNIFVDDSVALADKIDWSVDEANNKFTVTVTCKGGCSVKNIIIKNNDNQTETLYTGALNTNPVTFDYSIENQYFVTADLVTDLTIEANLLADINKGFWKDKLGLHQFLEIWYFDGSALKSIANSDLNNQESFDLEDGIRYYANDVFFLNPVYFTVRHYYPVSIKTDSQTFITIKQGESSIGTSGKVYTDVNSGSVNVEVKNRASKGINLSVNGVLQEKPSTSGDGVQVFTFTKDELDALVSVAKETGKTSLEFSVEYTRNNAKSVNDPNEYGTVSYTADDTVDTQDNIVATPSNGCKVEKIIVSTSTTQEGPYTKAEEILATNENTDASGKVTVANTNNGLPTYYEYSAVFSVEKTVDVNAATKFGNYGDNYGLTGNQWLDSDHLNDPATIGSYVDLLVDGTTNVAGSSSATDLDDGVHYYEIINKSHSYPHEEESRSAKTFFIVRHYYELKEDSDDISVKQNNEAVTGTTAKPGKLYRDKGDVKIEVAKKKGRTAKLYVNGNTTPIAAETDASKGVTFSSTDDTLTWVLTDAFLLANSRKLGLTVDYDMNNVEIVQSVNGHTSCDEAEDELKNPLVKVTSTPEKEYTVTSVKVEKYESKEKADQKQDAEEFTIELAFNTEGSGQSKKEAIATGTFAWDENAYYVVTPTIEEELVLNPMGEGETPEVKFVPEFYTPSEEEILKAIYKNDSPLLTAIYGNEEESLLEEVKDLLAAPKTQKITVEYLAAVVEQRTWGGTKEQEIWLPINFNMDTDQIDILGDSEFLKWLAGLTREALKERTNLHEFGELFDKTTGECTEQIRVTYENIGAGDQFTSYQKSNIDITLKDTRYQTKLNVPSTIVMTYVAEDPASQVALTNLIAKNILDKKLLKYIDENGAEQTLVDESLDTVEKIAAHLKVTPAHLDASLLTQTVKVEFTGNVDYKASSENYKVYVLRQGSKIDAHNQVVTYIADETLMKEAIMPLVEATGDDGNPIKYGYAIIGIEGDVEGYVALNIDTSSLVFSVPDNIVGGLAKWLNEKFGIKTEPYDISDEFNLGIMYDPINGTLDLGPAVINALDSVINNRNLDRIISIVNFLNDLVEKFGGTSAELGQLTDIINFAQEVLNNLPSSELDVHFGEIGKNEYVPTEAGAYAVIAATTDKNYAFHMDMGSLIINPVTDFTMDWVNQPGDSSAEFTVPEVRSEDEKGTWYKAFAMLPSEDGPGEAVPGDIVYTFSGVSASGELGIASKEVPTEAGLYFETATVYGNYYKTISRWVTIKKVDTELQVVYDNEDGTYTPLDGDIHLEYGDKGFTCNDVPYDDVNKIKAMVKAEDSYIEEANLYFCDIKLLDDDYLDTKFPTEAGDYRMIAFYEGDDVYRAALKLEREVIIDRRSVKVNVMTVHQVYGEPEQPLELADAPGYEGQFPEEVYFSGKPLAEELGITLTRIPGDNVGTYLITPTAESILTFNRNYELDGLFIEDLIRLTGEYIITERPLELFFEDNSYEVEYLDGPADVQAGYRDAYEEKDPDKNFDPHSDNLNIVYHYTGTDCYGLKYDSLFAPENVGTYEVTASLSILDPDSYNYDYESVSVPYIVTPRDIDDEDIVVVLDNLTYNGKVQKQRVVSVKDNEAKEFLSPLWDYSVSDSYAKDVRDDYEITITGKGNYEGTKTLTYSMAPKSMSLVFDRWLYNSTYGDEAPDVNVYKLGNVKDDRLYVVKTYKGTTAKGDEYESIYPPKDAGLYTVTATLAGRDAKNYDCDPAVALYLVLQQNIERTANIVLDEKLTYNGKVQDQDFSVYTGKGKYRTKLVEDVDYVVVNNSDEGKNAGKYKLTIEGIGNYSGKLSKEFTIEPKTVKVDYRHEPYKSVYMTEYDNVETNIRGLCGHDKLGLVYTYVDAETMGRKYKDTKAPTDAGKYYVITSIDKKSRNADNYKLDRRTVMTTYTVEPRTIRDADIELIGDALVYGESDTQEFSASVEFTWKELRRRQRHHVLDQDTEIDVKYNPEEITKPGVYDLIIEGKGNFKGKAKVPFVVLANNDEEAQNAGLINGDGNLQYGNGTIDVFATSKEEGMQFFKAEIDKSAVLAGSNIPAEELSDLVNGRKQPDVLELFFVVSKPEEPEPQTIVLGKNIGNIFDVDYFKRYNYGDAIELSDSGANVKFTVGLTPSMKNDNQSMRRYYSLITKHENYEPAFIASQYDESANTITFSTHLFSKYYVGYQDIPYAPKTGDDNMIALWFVLSIFALLAIGATSIILVKKKRDER